jgi:hypothetical protein
MSETTTIDDFKSKLKGGGARANLFEVIIPDPAVASGLDQKLLPFMCKGAQLPASTVAQIDVPYRGRQLKVAGDRTFENWTVTIFNEDAQLLRGAFERWMNSINSHMENKSQVLNPSEYQSDLIVTQQNRIGGATKTYQIDGAFPVNVSAVDLSYDANDAIEEFTVEFAYQYWTTGEAGSRSGITS